VAFEPAWRDREGDPFADGGLMSGRISALMVDFTGDKWIAAIFMHEFVTIV
jgi:hypothetical protein